eukprot:Platyproteum_vivax@DN13007_c0_g1_i1.p1
MFLEDVCTRFQELYPPDVIDDAIALTMNAHFSPILAEQMHVFNSMDTTNEKIQQVKSQVNEIKDLMVDNIDKILDRGEKIDLLVDITDDMNQNAFHFQRQVKARTLQRHYWWQNTRCYLLFLLCVIVFAASVLLWLCDKFDCSKHWKAN